MNIWFFTKKKQNQNVGAKKFLRVTKRLAAGREGEGERETDRRTETDRHTDERQTNRETERGVRYVGKEVTEVPFSSQPPLG